MPKIMKIEERKKAHLDKNEINIKQCQKGERWGLCSHLKYDSFYQ